MRMQYCISVWILKHNCTKTFPLTGKTMGMGIHNPCNWHADFPCVLLNIGYINFMTVCFMFYNHSWLSKGQTHRL